MSYRYGGCDYVVPPDVPGVRLQSAQRRVAEDKADYERKASDAANALAHLQEAERRLRLAEADFEKDPR